MSKVEDLKKFLFENVEVEKKAKLDTLELNKKIIEMENALENMELAVKTEINNAVDTDGKKIFTNEAGRTTELANRMKANVEYNKLSEEIQKVKFDVKVKEIETATIAHYISIGKIYLPLIAE